MRASTISTRSRTSAGSLLASRTITRMGWTATARSFGNSSRQSTKMLPTAATCSGGGSSTNGGSPTISPTETSTSASTRRGGGDSSPSEYPAATATPAPVDAADRSLGSTQAAPPFETGPWRRRAGRRRGPRREPHHRRRISQRAARRGSPGRSTPDRAAGTSPTSAESLPAAALAASAQTGRPVAAVEQSVRARALTPPEARRRRMVLEACGRCLQAWSLECPSGALRGAVPSCVNSAARLADECHTAKCAAIFFVLSCWPPSRSSRP